MGSEQLVARVAEQDHAAFRALYDKHALAVYRFALSILRSSHLAEDVLQETMMAVWKGARSFRGQAKVQTWILGIARNQAHNLLRKEARGRRFTEADPDPESHVGPDPTRRMYVDLRVQQALETLSSQHREVMHLVFYEGLTVRETAQILGIPEGTVKSRMHHARQALAKELT